MSGYMSCPSSRGAPSTPASLLVAASSSGIFNTTSSFSVRASIISATVGRDEVSGFLWVMCVCVLAQQMVERVTH